MIRGGINGFQISDNLQSLRVLSGAIALQLNRDVCLGFCYIWKLVVHPNVLKLAKLKAGNSDVLFHAMTTCL